MSRKIGKRAFVIAAGAVVMAASVSIAGPASAKNNCGPLNVYKDGPLASTGHVAQSCDAGTQATYKVQCLFGSSQFTRYYPIGLTATTNVSCPGGSGNPIRSVTVSY